MSAPWTADQRADLDKLLRSCVECGLCTHVCPSKLELVRQFEDAKALLKTEREEAIESVERGERGE